MRILLVSPFELDEVASVVAKELPFLGQGPSGAQQAPLGALTIAAVTPARHEVDYHDERIHGPVEPLLDDRPYDVVGISTYSQVIRPREIAEYCKRKRLPTRVAIGGPGVEYRPGEFARFADALFVGEAEESWPRFLLEVEEGRSRLLYHPVSKPDIRLSPVPRWDLVQDDVASYGAGAVQVTRGCPFNCNFCGVIYRSGRRFRTKPVSQVLEEIRLQEKLGFQAIAFADDNLSGNKRYFKQLLREIARLNNSFDRPLMLMGQTDLTIARDPELLELMADCNFVHVLIGIESPGKAALESFDKRHNLVGDVVEAIRRIQSYGLAVHASCIFGADADGPEAFSATEAMLREAHVTDQYAYPLNAPPGTRLWYQLQAQGRVLDFGHEIPIQFLTNVVPRRMSRPELFEGMATYFETVFNPRHYAERAIGFVHGIKRKPQVKATASPLRDAWRNRGTVGPVMRYLLLQAPEDIRRTFRDIARATQKTAPFMSSNLFLLHILFLVNHKRALYAALRFRQRAELERKRPDVLPPPVNEVPVPGWVRENTRPVLDAAFDAVRPGSDRLETCCQMVVGALSDLVDEVGDAPEGFDDVLAERLRLHCGRAMGRVSDMLGGATPMFDGQVPPWLAREVVDALDSIRRFRALLP